MNARTIQEIRKLVEKHGFKVAKKKGIFFPNCGTCAFYDCFCEKRGA